MKLRKYFWNLEIMKIYTIYIPHLFSPKIISLRKDLQVSAPKSLLFTPLLPLEKNTDAPKATWPLTRNHHFSSRFFFMDSPKPTAAFRTTLRECLLSEKTTVENIIRRSVTQCTPTSHEKYEKQAHTYYYAVLTFDRIMSFFSATDRFIA